MQIQNKFNKIGWTFLTASICLNLACTAPATNSTNAPVNSNVSVNANRNSSIAANSNAVNTNVSNNAGAMIETKEPEQYQATVTLKFELSGAQSVAVPPIKADVARNGADRRMEFVMPGGEKLIYLDHDGKQYVIAANKKQYAELTKEALGFEVRKLLMPEQIVNQVKTMKGMERVGEEKVDGRDAVKYRYGTTTDTQTKAGTVATESFVLIDKETSLPLRSVTNSQSQNGNVQGVKSLSFITEMTNIRTTAAANLFAPPTDMKQVSPEEIKAQVDMIFNAATAILGQMMKSAQPAVSPNQ